MTLQITDFRLTTRFKDPKIHQQVVDVFIKELGVLSKCGIVPVKMTVSDPMALHSPEHGRPVRNINNPESIYINWEEEVKP